MRLYTTTQAAAQQYADAFYSRLQASNPLYAANMQKWDTAHPELDVGGVPTGRWFVNIDGGITPVMQAVEVQLVPELVAVEAIAEELP